MKEVKRKKGKEREEKKGNRGKQKYKETNDEWVTML